jgi:Zn-dependent peptidase ImmA (M78 family)
VTLRRGFKAEAERISAEVRREMNLSLEDRLDPSMLARHLCIPVIDIEMAARRLGKPDFGRYFLIEDVESLSAMTLFHGRKRIVLHNGSHAPTRQASNIAHEISHCLLEHIPGPVLRPDGCRYWNEGMEAEAAWLGGALLVPRIGALQHARAGLAVDQIARHFAVSSHLCRWRMNETGIAQQLRRYATFRSAKRQTAAR